VTGPGKDGMSFKTWFRLKHQLRVYFISGHMNRCAISVRLSLTLQIIQSSRS
jgi:hypothetical protein